MIELSGLSCACAVRVNGAYAGDIWTHPLRLNIAKFVRPGENVIELRAASTLINEMRAAGPEWPRCETEIAGWPYYGKSINDHRQAMNTRCEHEEQLSPLPSGIWGPVSLLIQNNQEQGASV